MTVNCKGCGYLKGKCTYDGLCQNKQMMEECYQQGRADERTRLLSLADCDNAECWNCAMADGDMNCILKEQKNE